MLRKSPFEIELSAEEREELKARAGKYTSPPKEQVISERRELARMLGIPPSKLTPEDRLQDIARRAGFFGSDSVALNDLDEELIALFTENGLEKPAARATTVAEAIHQLSTARRPD